jgi:hypothetical protein
LNEVKVLQAWGPGMGNANKIPSVISYSPSIKSERQWGGDISDEAVTMVHTKLELDVQDDKLDELELILQVLDGTRDLGFDNVKRCGGDPEYTWKDPEDIVTDFLINVFDHIRDSLGYFQATENAKQQTKVDIVITVPQVS